MCIALVNFDIDTMYHYCSLDSFFSIVKNQELWLTRADYTNDIYEMQYVDHKMLEIANEMLENGEITEEASRDLKMFYNREDYYGKMFIGCFSRQGENLSQWRLYADDAKGVSIGFNVAQLIRKNCIRPDLSILMSGYVGYKVKYFDKAMKEEIKEDLRDNVRENANYDITIKDFIRFKENDYIKGDEFKFEEEYRILYNPAQKQIGNYRFDVGNDFYRQGDMDFRVRDNKLVPYWKMPIGGAISEVIIGSKCSASETEMKNFLMKYGFSEAVVRRSELSYR